MRKNQYRILNYEILDDVAYFQVKGTKLHSIRIPLSDNIKISPMACDCEFGSYYSQTKTNLENKKICHHLRKCLELLKHLEEIKEWEYD